MKKQCMYYFMRMKQFVLLTAMTVMSSGCVNVMHQWGYSCVKTPVVEFCSSSAVLITNLNKSVSQQQLLLPNGQPCEERIYEN